MDDSTKKILEIVTDIQDKMSTKVQLEDVRTDLQSQISANTKAIAELTEHMRNVFGYAKEIDSLMSRMSEVEKRVGMTK